MKQKLNVKMKMSKKEWVSNYVASIVTYCMLTYLSLVVKTEKWCKLEVKSVKGSFIGPFTTLYRVV